MTFAKTEKLVWITVFIFTLFLLLDGFQSFNYFF